MKDRETIVDELFAQVVELAPTERQALFAERAAKDSLLVSEGVIAEVKALLQDFQSAEDESFLHQPLISPDVVEGRSQTLAEGQEFEGYRILKLLGEGGMGEVYLAEDSELDRKVAIKLIKSNLKSREVLRRFYSERQILANLQHPNIARLFEASATRDGLPFFVMEYVEGEPIDKYADEQGLSITERLKLFRSVCSAVSYAHRNLVIHRDIKPGNILVTKDGEPKLLDFGIAKLLHEADAAEQDVTATLFRVMTPEYASPEQVKGEPITTATDVYSLGVLLYELLTGERPYILTRQTANELTKAICEQEPTKPSQAIADVELRNANLRARSVNPQAARPQSEIRNPKLLRGDLDNIVLKALRKEPERRYASVEQFSEDIERHLEGLPVRARKDTFGYRASKFVQRNKVGVIAATLILLTLIGGIIATAWEAHVARNERARAEERFNEVRALAHTFIFDLNDEIGKGPTQARALLVGRALEYLGSLAQEAGDDRGLRQEMASAYLKIGDLQGAPYAENLGDLRGALASYQKAITSLGGLAASQPRDLNTRRDLSDAYQRISELESRSGDLAASLESGRKSVELCEALLKADPSNAEYRAFAGRAYLSLGDAQARVADDELSLGGRRSALENYRKSLAIYQSLLDADPLNNELRRHVMQDNERIGFTYEAISRLDGDAENKRQSLASLKKALELSQALLDSEPSNAHFRRGLAGSWMEVGLEQSNLDDDAGAMKSYGKSQPIFEELAAADPTNLEAQRDLLSVYARAAISLAKLNDARRSQEYARRALSIFARLHAADPKNIEDRFNAELMYDSTGDALSKAGDASGALDNYRKAVEIDEEWLAVEPGSAKGRRALANQYAKLGNAYVMIASDAKTSARRKAEGWREARSWYQKSLDIYQEMKSKGTLSGADAGKPDEVSNEIAGCDEALKKLRAK